MGAVTDDQYYMIRAEQELDMAALATDPIVKALHLNMAAEYATLRERAEVEISNAENTTSDRITGFSSEPGRAHRVR
jgi:hypothetical protein